jgi:uncharacterized protein (TIGR02145 family)
VAREKKKEISFKVFNFSGGHSFMKKPSFSRPVGFFVEIAHAVIITGLIFISLSCNGTNPVGNNDNNLVYGSMSDIDGNVYKTIKIGNQVWTAENLRTTKYNDGTSIPFILMKSTWDSCFYTEGGAYCYYKSTTNSDSIKKFGALYNWYTIATQKIAPIGWHIPTDSEWDTLENYLITNGYNWDGTLTGNKIAKSLAAKTDWGTYDTTGTIGNNLTLNNRSGFSALPGGDRFSTVSISAYFGLHGAWWSSTTSNSSHAYCRELYYLSRNLLTNYYRKNSGLSVRLLRD